MRYTRRDIEIMREHYPTGGFDAVRRKLRGRTRQAIHKLASRLGLECNSRWTVEADAELAEHYPDKGPRDTAALMGRSVVSVRERAYVLGIAYVGIPVPRQILKSETGAMWPTEQDEVLIENYETFGAKRTAALLPGRTLIAVRQRAYALGLRADRSARCRVRYVDRMEAQNA